MTNRILLSAAAAAILVGPAPVGAQRQTPPPAAAPRDFRLPETRTFTLDNGMKVTLIPFGTVPKVTARLVVRSGNIDERPGEVFLPDLVGRLMNEGTTSMSAQELAETVASMGGAVFIGIGLDESTINGEVLSEHAPSIVRVIADMARNPLLPESEFERIRTDMIRENTIALSSPQTQAGMTFARAMYGEHPYGTSWVATEEQLRRHSYEDVRRFHRDNWGAQRAHLFIAGVFDQAATERAIRDAFGDWQRGNPPTVNVPQPTITASVHTVDRDDAVQSTIMWGLPVPDPSHQDYMALQVMDDLLGGSFGSRITANIREDKGYTYSPSSSVASRYRNAYWAQSADVTTDVTGPSLDEITNEIRRLQNEAPTETELRGIQNYMAGLFTLQNGSRSGVIGQLSFVDLHGLPRTYLTEYVQNIYEVTPDEISRIAREYIQPEKMTLVVVGDPETLAEQLQKFRPVNP